MKKTILLFTALLSFAVSAQAASTPMAETTISGTTPDEKELVALFNKEAKIKNSKLSAYLTGLKNDPENKDYFIEDTINTADIVRLDSGAGGGTFEINYLILIRAGYKSNTFQVGYLKAQVSGSIEESSPTTLKIIEPAKVTIE